MTFAQISPNRFSALSFLNWVQDNASSPAAAIYARLIAAKSWDDVTTLAASGHFTSADIQAVDALSSGQKQVYTFLQTVERVSAKAKQNDPGASTLEDVVKSLADAGGWASIVDFVAKNRAPYSFTAADAKSVLDPTGTIVEHTPGQVDVLMFMQAIKKTPELDASINTLVQGAQWSSIVELVEKNKAPFSFTVEDLKAILDPDGKLTTAAAAANSPASPPTWTVPIVWGMTTGMAIADWTEGAAGSVADWSQGAAGAVAGWSTGALNAAGDWSKGAIDTATTGVVDAAKAAQDAANSAADWASHAAQDAASAVKSTAETVAEKLNPLNWF